MPPRIAELTTPEVPQPTLSPAEYGAPVLAEATRTIATAANGTEVDLGQNLRPLTESEVLSRDVHSGPQAAAARALALLGVSADQINPAVIRG